MHIFRILILILLLLLLLLCRDLSWWWGKLPTNFCPNVLYMGRVLIDCQLPMQDSDTLAHIQLHLTSLDGITSYRNQHTLFWNSDTYLIGMQGVSFRSEHTAQLCIKCCVSIAKVKSLTVNKITKLKITMRSRSKGQSYAGRKHRILRRRI